MAKGLPTDRIENLRPSIYGRSVDDYFLTTTVNDYFLTITFTTTLTTTFVLRLLLNSTAIPMLRTVRLNRIRSSSKPLKLSSNVLRLRTSPT